MNQNEQAKQTNGERRDNYARIAMLLTIILTVANLIGATAFWITLPEKMRQTNVQLADHETRIRAAETRGGETSNTLVRVDERTKAIQESIADLKISMRGTQRP